MENMPLQSESINELSTALAKAQLKMKAPVKDKKNPHFRNEYASMGSVLNSCKDALNDQGISLTQPIIETENKTYVVTTLTHTSGQWMRSYFSLRVAASATSQQVGSAITYARRYSLCAMVGIDGDEDDDANEAEKAPPKNTNNDRVHKGPISQEKYDQMMKVVGPYPELQDKLKSLCKVKDLRQIDEEKFKACSKLSSKWIKEKEDDLSREETVSDSELHGSESDGPTWHDDEDN